jgi:Ca2+-binding EF-hand superfamily protein
MGPSVVHAQGAKGKSPENHKPDEAASVAAQATAHPQTKVNDVPVIDLMHRLGAKFEKGTTVEELDQYANHFDRTDPNRDGKHTKAEYVDGGRYMTPQARAGIFNAADENHDGVVTRSEYVLNRIITDEGKGIIQKMDSNRNGTVQEREFLMHASKQIGNKTLTTDFFTLLDRNRDGAIPIPEYLRIWGQWAREGRGTAEQRISNQRKQLANLTALKERNPSTAHESEKHALAQGSRAENSPGRTRLIAPPTVDQVFERFDNNRDGKLVEAEIAVFAQKYILPADSNQDKMVTKKELDTYRKTNRGGPPNKADRKSQQ